MRFSKQTFLPVSLPCLYSCYTKAPTVCVRSRGPLYFLHIHRSWLDNAPYPSHQEAVKATSNGRSGALYRRIFMKTTLRTVINLTPWSRDLLGKLIVAQLVKNDLTFVQAKGSLPCSQESTMVPILNPHYFSKIWVHSNFILPSTSRSSKWFLPHKFSDQNLYAFPHIFSCVRLRNFLYFTERSC
jgi:hypothetical protein